MPATVSTEAAKKRAQDLRMSSDTLSQRTAVTPQDVTPLCQEARGAAEALAAARDDGETELKNCKAKLAQCETSLANVGHGLDAARTTNGLEGFLDGCRLAFVLIPAGLAFFIPAPWSGRVAVRFGMAYVILIIAAVAIRSDSTYDSKKRPLRKTTLGDCAYQVLPSYVVPCRWSSVFSWPCGWGLRRCFSPTHRRPTRGRTARVLRVQFLHPRHV